MTTYFQHVGEQGAARDFPRTIGTQKKGLVTFDLDEVDDYLHELPGGEILFLKDVIAEKAPDGFQIWGIPAGARPVIRRMTTGGLSSAARNDNRGRVLPVRRRGHSAAFERVRCAVVKLPVTSSLGRRECRLEQLQRRDMEVVGRLMQHTSITGRPSGPRGCGERARRIRGSP